MYLDRAEAALIKDSFRAVTRDRPAAAAAFYRHLFRIAPTARDLFVTDMDRQGAKLIATLDVVASQIDNFGLLRTTLDDLALRHTAYGVIPTDYPAVGEALVAMLAERLGAPFTAPTEAAWRKVFALIESAMIDAGYRKDAEPDEPSHGGAASGA